MAYNDPSWRGTSNSPSGPEARIIRRDLVDLAARDGDQLPNGCEAYVLSQRNSYILDTSSSQAADGLTTIARPGLLNGRWATLQAFISAQSAWFVDLNAGSDSNDGLTALTPFKTASKLMSVLCPGGTQYILTQNVTVNFAGTATYPELNLNIATAENATTVFTLTVLCAITSTAAITLSAVVQPNSLTTTRGELTTLAGTFVSKSRIRLTSGASSGAIAYSTGLHAGALNTYVSGFYDPTPAGAFTARSASVNDTCVVDTLTVTFTRLNISASGNARVVVQDAKLVTVAVGGTAGTGAHVSVGNGGGQVFFSGCAQTGAAATWQNTSNGCTLAACVTSGATTQLAGGNWLLIGHVSQGVLKLGDGSLITQGLTLDGGSVVIGGGGGTGLGVSGAAKWIPTTPIAAGCGLIEAENGTGGLTAITLSPGSSIQVFPGVAADITWGASAVYGVGWVVSPNSYVQLGNASTTNFGTVFALPSTVNFQVSGHNYAYSANQICEPNSNCGIIAANFSGANLCDGPPVYSKLQNANIGATSTNLSQPGLGKLFGYLACTTADAAAIGAPTLNAIFTDDSGVSRTVTVCSLANLTALGGAGGEVVMEANGVAPQWSIAGITSAGNAKYSVRVRSTVISSGP